MWVEWEVKGQEREGEIVWWRRVLILCSGGGPWRPLEACTQVLSSFFFLVEGKATCCGVLTSFDLDALIAPPSLSLARSRSSSPFTDHYMLFRKFLSSLKTSIKYHYYLINWMLILCFTRCFSWIVLRNQLKNSLANEAFRRSSAVASSSPTHIPSELYKNRNDLSCLEKLQGAFW